MWTAQDGKRDRKRSIALVRKAYFFFFTLPKCLQPELVLDLLVVCNMYINVYVYKYVKKCVEQNASEVLSAQCVENLSYIFKAIMQKQVRIYSFN